MVWSLRELERGSSRGVGVSWLRLDDGFGTNPKVLELSEAKRWRWVALLLTCARHRKYEGRVTRAALLEHRLDVGELVCLGLLDQLEDGSYRVHDWDEFNDSENPAADRQRRYRMRRAGVPESEVLAAVPPRGEGGRGNEGRVNRDVTRDVTRDVVETSFDSPIRAPASRPKVNYKPRSTQTARQDHVGSARFADEDEPHELVVARLIRLMPADETARDLVRATALRASSSSVRAAVLKLGEGGAADPVGRALELLENAG